MATVKKMKKAQDGYMGKKAPKDSMYTESGKLISKKDNETWQKGVTKSMNDQYFNRPENKKAAPKKVAVPKKKMKEGGSLKPVAADQKGLAKLPTPVRNKMGYQKTGGKTKKAMSGTKMMKGGGKCKYGC